MMSRLKRELHEFLIQDDISLESNIVNDLIYEMIGVGFANDKEDLRYNFGFQLSTDYWERNSHKAEPIKFKLPSLTLPQLLQYLDFFKIPHDKYVTNASLPLDNAFVFDELLPKFKAYYCTLKAKDPAAIVRYKVESRPILEASAISTLKQYTDEAIATILPDPTLGAVSDTAPLVDAMLLLESKVKKLDKKPIFYKSIIETGTQIEAFLIAPALDQNKELKKQLRLVSEGIDLFARYHRNESVIANILFFKEMEKFLNEQKISSSQCDVIEETLLRLAGAELGKKGKCGIEKGYDAARLVFKFTDISKESAAKVIQYCQALGDETAKEGWGHKTRGSSLPMLKAASASYEALESAPANYVPTEKEVIESHSVEVDGKFFYGNMFPRLKDEILAMQVSAPDILERYRMASKSHLDKLAKKNEEANLSKNKSVLFQLPMNEGESQDMSVVASKRVKIG